VKCIFFDFLNEGGRKEMRKIVLSIMVMAFSLALASTSFAKKAKYKEGSAGSGSITGTVSLKGTPMAPIIEDLTKGKNVEFCTTHPEAKEGKPWGDAGKFNYDFKKCDVVQKMGVIRKPTKAEKKSGGILTVTNNDPDTLHNPHGYSVKGASRKTLFNKPLPSQGDIAEVTKNIARLKEKKDKHFFLQCDQHNWMEADARIVWNPYYSVTGADGAFAIDGVPAGKYKVTAWQPYVGETTQEVTVGDGAVKADFTITAK
jgi:hypothetical protein